MFKNTDKCRICKRPYGNDLVGHMSTLFGRIYICGDCNKQHYEAIQEVCNRHGEELIAFIDSLSFESTFDDKTSD